jgi:iron complex outermembrane receptor protein
VLRGDGKYQSKIYFDQFNSDAADQGGYTLFNARIELISHDERWTLALWGKNLSD